MCPCSCPTRWWVTSSASSRRLACSGVTSRTTGRVSADEHRYQEDRTDSAQDEQQLTARATAKFVRVTPMKARRVLDLIRGKDAADALDILRFAPQSASEPVAKVLASAMANAENNLDLDPRTLVVSTVFADEGPTLKRFRPRAQGRAF